MPFANPIGGFLTIIHLFINMVAFAYRKIKRLFKNDPSHRSAIMRWLTDKDGDSVKRRFLAYALTFCVIAGITGFTTSVLILQSEFKTTSIAPDVTEAASPAASVTERPVTNIPEIPATIVAEVPSVETNIQDKNSLVDLLRFAVISDPSFDERASLAESLKIVENKDDYTGSLEQNKAMMAIIKEIYGL